MVEGLALRRVGAVEAPGQHGDGAAGQGAPMGGTVNAPGQAGDDDPALLREFPRHGLRQEPAIGRGIARPDHGNGAARQQLNLAEGQKQGRGVIGFGEHRGKSRVGHDQEPAAEAAELGQLALGCRGWAVARGHRRPPRRASSGRASRAASALPKRRSSWRKVTGPTFSLRQRRSQASR